MASRGPRYGTVSTPGEQRRAVDCILPAGRETASALAQISATAVQPPFNGLDEL
jgi:hypothetical protein